jgi:hypothetical protein
VDEKGSSHSHGTVNPDHTGPRLDKPRQNTAGSLLGLAYESSNEEQLIMSCDPYGQEPLVFF